MARVFLFLNAQETVNPKDIMTDAFHNFHPQYQSYTQYSASKLIARKIYKYIFSSYNKFLLLGGSGTRSGAGGRTSRGGTFDADDSSSSNHHQQHRITPTLHQPPGQSTTSASNSIPLTVTSPVVSGVSTAPRSPRTNTTATATGQTSSSTSSTAPAAAGAAASGVPVPPGTVLPSRLAYTEKTMLLSSDDEFQWAHLLSSLSI